ncbi:MAG: hypothetical protein J6M18_00460 [Actinomycetaceae bacterium]|nr:hypothetical protein [Actinomycetaceae bacterium]
MGTKSCYTVLLASNGTWNLFKHDFIEYSTPFWSDDTLYLSDLKHEYIFEYGKTPVVHDMKKEGLLLESRVLYENKLFSFYNWGFDDGDMNEDTGYSYEMIVQNVHKATRSVLPLMMDSEASVCGNQILAVGRKKSLGDEARALYSFSENGSYVKLFDADYVIDNEKSKILGINQEIVCWNDTHLLEIAYDANKSEDQYNGENELAPTKLFLGIWDIHNKEYTVLPLMDENEKQFAFTENLGSDDLEVIFADGNTLYAQLVQQGRIAKIDISTGTITFINEPLQKSDNEGNYRYQVRSDYLHGKVYQFVDDLQSEEDTYMRVVDVYTGKELQRIEYPGLTEGMMGLSPSSLAVNPRF